MRDRSSGSGGPKGTEITRTLIPDPALRNLWANRHVRSLEGSRLVIEAPVETGVRDIVDPIRSEYPNATLVAQREHDHRVTDIGGPDGILESLTDRQREVPEAAYLAGYFSWPRDSTANEVAESLDLASATLHGHLRKAEEEILTTLFDAE